MAAGQQFSRSVSTRNHLAYSRYRFDSDGPGIPAPSTVKLRTFGYRGQLVIRKIGRARDVQPALDCGFHLVSVLLRSHLPSEPFAGIDAQPRAGDYIVIDRLAVVGLIRVIAAVIRNRKDVLGQLVGLRISRARVLVRIVGEPS